MSSFCRRVTTCAVAISGANVSSPSFPVICLLCSNMSQPQHDDSDSELQVPSIVTTPRVSPRLSPVLPLQAALQYLDRVDEQLGIEPPTIPGDPAFNDPVFQERKKTYCERLLPKTLKLNSFVQTEEQLNETIRVVQASEQTAGRSTKQCRLLKRYQLYEDKLIQRRVKDSDPVRYVVSLEQSFDKLWSIHVRTVHAGINIMWEEAKV
jgi:hypothetical protein